MRRLIVAVAAALVASVLTSATALAAAGDPDTSFAGTGYAITGIGSVAQYTNGQFGPNATAVAVQSDGKIVVGGYALRAAVQGSPLAMAVLRFNPDGTLDTTFDGDGKAYVDVGTDSSVAAMALHDGKIYLAGRVTDPGPTDYKWAVVRLTSTGAKDTSFNGDGVSETTITSANSLDQPTTLQVLADGTITIGGTDGPGPTKAAVLRLDANGTPIAGFGSGGVFTYAPPGSVGAPAHGAGAFSLPNGTVVLGGYGTFSSVNQAFAARIKADGSGLDTGYGTAGVTIAPPPDPAVANLAFLDNEGRLLVSSQRLSSPGHAILTRFTSGGAIDTGFGTGGSFTLPDTHTVLIQAMVEQPDGKLLVEGSGTEDGAASMFVARVSAAGALDPTWSGDGIASFTGDYGAQGGGIALQADTKVIQAGGTYSAGRIGIATERLHGDSTTPVVVPPGGGGGGGGGGTTPPPDPGPGEPPAGPGPVASPHTPLTALTLPKGDLAAFLKGRLVATATCSAACQVTASLTVAPATAKKLKLTRKATAVTVGTATATRTAAGVLTLTFTPTKALAGTLKKVKTLAVSVVIQATDAASHQTFGSTKTLTLKAPKTKKAKKAGH